MKRRRSSLPSPLLVAGGAALAYAGVRALLGLVPGADEDFFKWTGPTEKDVDVGSARVDLPIMYYRDDCFMGIFGAALKPVRALLPSHDLHPVTLPDGRATLVVIAFNYHETSIAPYGEIGLALPCTLGTAAPPLLPLALEARYPGWGAFVLHLPVTSLVARDTGRTIWGYAKFVADMVFEKRPAYQRVDMSEGGRHILTLTIKQQGPAIKDNRPLVTYSVRDRDLLRTTVPTRAVYQLGAGANAGLLELGDHEVAHQLRALDVSATPFMTKNYLSRAGILPAGERVGTADRAHEPYPGTDTEYAQLIINYDDRETVDVYTRRAG